MLSMSVRRNYDASDSHQDSPSHGADAAELLQASRNASASSPRGAEDASIGRGERPKQSPGTPWLYGRIPTTRLGTPGTAICRS